MVYKIEELQEQLISDPDLRILFVEREHDLRLWRKLIAENGVENGEVYPISSVYLQSFERNNRGKCLGLISATAEWKQNSRLRVFIDADNDHILGTTHDSRVIVTDCRDLESYALDDEIIETVCCMGLGGSASNKEESINDINTAVRPIGILRALSEKEVLLLPFKETYPNGSLRRVWVRSGKHYQSNISSIIIALLNKQHGSASSLNSILTKFSLLSEATLKLNSSKIVHGKDLLLYLSKKYDVDKKVVSGVIRLSLESLSLKVGNFPNVRTALNWLAI